MKDEANYCRNVDGSSRPWCFVQGETGPVKEYCSIPLCCKWIQMFIIGLIINLSNSWKKFNIQWEKTLNFLFVTFSLAFDIFFFKTWALHAIYNVTSCTLVVNFTGWRWHFWHFHSVKITACENITFIQWIQSGISWWK